MSREVQRRAAVTDQNTQAIDCGLHIAPHIQQSAQIARRKASAYRVHTNSDRFARIFEGLHQHLLLIGRVPKS